MPNISLPEVLAVLERTPGALRALLLGLPAPWTEADEGPETWSPLVVVGHLLHGEDTDWIARARIILEEGEARPFDPFDRFGQVTRFEGWSLERRLDAFALRRGENLATLRSWNLGERELALPGTHPSFGRVTLSQLLATWAVHDMNHLGQIVRVMSGRYDQAVGPWKQYLPILHRTRVVS